MIEPLLPAPHGIKGRVASFIRALRILLSFGWRADRREFVTIFAVVGGSQVLYLSGNFGVKVMADAVTRHSWPGAFVSAILIGGGRELGNMLFSLYSVMQVRLEEKASQVLRTHLVELTAGIPTIEHHERPEYVRELDLLRDQGQLLAQTTNAVLLNFRTYIGVLGGALLLARIHPLMAVLPLCGLASAWTQKRATAWSEEGRERSHPHWLWQEHVRGLTIAPATAKEIRVFGLMDELIRRYAEEARIRTRIQFGANVRGAALNVVGSLAFQVGYMGCIGLALLRAVEGEATVGDVLLAVTLATQMNGLMFQVVEWGNYLDRAMRAARRLMWLQDYADGAARRVVTEPLPTPERLDHGVTLDDLSFHYPGTDKPILEHVTLHLPAGKMVALVGENGAGKSSLVKLLCRFYEPASGRILADGVDVRHFDAAEWQQRLSGGFQDFARFELLAREAVGVGDLARAEDEPAVRTAVARGSADDVVGILPHGLATQLGKAWTDGVELSGGQWQKLALARGSMRDQPLLLVLDEPTAALDAQTEHALFTRYADAAHRGETAGGITLVVSHRFSTVRMADLIVVMDSCQVVESGSHAELMARGGLYAELYELQARAYR